MPANFSASIGQLEIDLRVVKLDRPSEQICSDVWAAAGFDDTLLRWKMKLEVANGHEKEVQPRVQA